MFDRLLNLFGRDSLVLEVGVILVVTLALSLATRGILAFLRQRSGDIEASWNGAFLNALAPPLRLMIWVVGVGLACETVASGLETPIARAINSVRDLGAIVAITWFLVRFIKHAQQNLIRRKTREGGKIDEFAVTTIGKLLRLVTFIVASLVALQTPRAQHCGDIDIRWYRRNCDRVCRQGYACKFLWWIDAVSGQPFYRRRLDSIT